MEKWPNKSDTVEVEDPKVPSLNEGILHALEVVRDFKQAEDLSKSVQSEIGKSKLLLQIAEDKFQAGLPSSYLIKGAEDLTRRMKKANERQAVLKEIVSTKSKTGASDTDIREALTNVEYSVQDYFTKRIPDGEKEGLFRTAIRAGVIDEAEYIASTFSNNISMAQAYRSIAVAETKKGLNPVKSLDESRKATEKINVAVDKSKSFSSLALREFEAGIDYKDSLENAKKEASSIKNPKSKKERYIAFFNIANSEVKIGLDPKNSFNLAKEAVEGIQNKADKAIAFMKIARVEAKANIDPKESFKKSEDILETIEDDVLKKVLLNDLISHKANAGLFEEARMMVDKIAKAEEGDIAPIITGKGPVPALLIEISRAELTAGVDNTKTIEKACLNIQSIADLEARSKYWKDISSLQLEGGLFDEAKKTAGKIRNFQDKMIAFREVAIAEAKAGKFDEAKKTIENIDSDYSKALAISAIAAAESRVGLSFEQIKNLNEETLSSVISQGRDDLAYALGYFRTLEAEKLSASSPNHVKNSLILGKAERERESGIIFEVSSSVNRESDDVEKRALSRSLGHLDYEIISDQLMAKIKAEKDPSNQIRYLKTLIEVENPKGRNLATKLYINPEVPPRLKEYLLRKLISEGYWDKELGSFLDMKLKGGTSKEEIDAILTEIIGTLNLIPDRMTYEVLEPKSPEKTSDDIISTMYFERLLNGNTLEEKIEEIKSYKERFKDLNRDALLELFKNDKKSANLFYLVNGGEYSYSLINDYSFNKFSLIIDKINNLEIDKKRMTSFRTALNSTGLPKKEVGYILEELKAGRFPYMEEGRTITFSSSVEEGSEYSKYLARLQEVWSGELLKLITVSLTENKPSNMAELDSTEVVVGLLDGENQDSRRAKRFISQFGIGEKQTRQSMLGNASIMRKELLQRAKQQNDKELREKLSTLTDSAIITEFFETFLPKLNTIGAYSEEWRSHISEVLTGLEATEDKQENSKSKDVEVELTFLDKGKDFIRAVRFADGQQCCFNSTNYVVHSNLGSSDWIARLNKDPLSFVTDIKVKGSKQISGFVFGRMGINPTSKRPVVMLNGIYSQESGPVFADNVLKIIEDRFAKKIGADLIVVASKHGGRLSKTPTGYRDSRRNIKAIRALEGDSVYDDIGQVANGSFFFADGFEKDIV